VPTSLAKGAIRDQEWRDRRGGESAGEVADEHRRLIRYEMPSLKVIPSAPVG
jgi:hypothetical protein